MFQLLKKEINHLIEYSQKKTLTPRRIIVKFRNR